MKEAEFQIADDLATKLDENVDMWFESAAMVEFQEAMKRASDLLPAGYDVANWASTSSYSWTVIFARIVSKALFR